MHSRRAPATHRSVWNRSRVFTIFVLFVIGLIGGVSYTLFNRFAARGQPSVSSGRETLKTPPRAIRSGREGEPFPDPHPHQGYADEKPQIASAEMARDPFHLHETEPPLQHIEALRQPEKPSLPFDGITCPPYDQGIANLQIPLKHLPRKKPTTVSEKYDRRSDGCASRGIWHNLQLEDHRRILHHIVRLAHIKRDSFVLDWGSGCGHSLQFLVEQYGAHGVGLDVSNKTVMYARANTSQKNMHCVADGTRLQWLPSDTFDHVFSFGSIYHVYNRTVFCHVLRQLVRVVKPGGTVYNGWTENGEFHRRHIPLCFADLPVRPTIFEELVEFKDVVRFPLKAQQQRPNTYSLVIEKLKSLTPEQEAVVNDLTRIPIRCKVHACELQFRGSPGERSADDEDDNGRVHRHEAREADKLSANHHTDGSSDDDPRHGVSSKAFHKRKEKKLRNEAVLSDAHDEHYRDAVEVFRKKESDARQAHEALLNENRERKPVKHPAHPAKRPLAVDHAESALSSKPHNDAEEDDHSSGSSSSSSTDASDLTSPEPGPWRNFSCPREGRKHKKQMNATCPGAHWPTFSIEDRHELLDVVAKLLHLVPTDAPNQTEGTATEPMTVLDWGSGCGESLEYFASQYGTRGFGIDLDSSVVSFARHNTKRNMYCVANGTKLQWVPTDSFDRAFSFGSLYLLQSEAAVCDTLRELVRITKPGGYVYAGWLTTKDLSRFEVTRCLDAAEVAAGPKRTVVKTLEEKEIFGDIASFPRRLNHLTGQSRRSAVPKTYSVLVQRLMQD